MYGSCYENALCIKTRHLHMIGCLLNVITMRYIYWRTVDWLTWCKQQQQEQCCHHPLADRGETKVCHRHVCESTLFLCEHGCILFVNNWDTCIVLKSKHRNFTLAQTHTAVYLIDHEGEGVCCFSFKIIYIKFANYNTQCTNVWHYS